MKRYISIIILLLIVIALPGQSTLRKEGIYEVGDTTIEVYNWKEPFAIREFKTINGTDMILFREFNGITKKLKQEGMFKGGYSSGKWKFYGWTGRLKKEVEYDNMVKTFYSKKNIITAVDFDFEKFKEDSLFVYNYRKQKSESTAGAVAKASPEVATPVAANVNVDSAGAKKTTLLGGLFSKRKKEDNTTAEVKKETADKTVDSVASKQAAIPAKDPKKKTDVTNATAKKTDLKSGELPKNATDSAKSKKTEVAVKGSTAGAKKENSATVKATEPKKEEAPKSVAAAPKAEQKKEAAKTSPEPKKESAAPATVKAAEPKKEEAPKPVAAAPKPEQKKEALKAAPEPKKESAAPATVKAAEPKKEETPKPVAAAPKPEQKNEAVKATPEPKKENVTPATIKVAESKKTESPKAITNTNKAQQSTVVAKDPVQSKKENVASLKSEPKKIIDSTNYRANEILAEEYSKRQMEKFENSASKRENINVPIQNKTTDSVKGKQSTNPVTPPVKNNSNTESHTKAVDTQQSKTSAEVASTASYKKPEATTEKSVKSEKESNTNTTGRTSNLKAAEPKKSVADSVKKNADSLLIKKTVVAVKAINDSTKQQADRIKK